MRLAGKFLLCGARQISQPGRKNPIRPGDPLEQCNSPASPIVALHQPAPLSTFSSPSLSLVRALYLAHCDLRAGGQPLLHARPALNSIGFQQQQLFGCLCLLSVCLLIGAFPAAAAALSNKRAAMPMIMTSRIKANQRAPAAARATCVAVHVSEFAWARARGRLTLFILPSCF